MRRWARGCAAAAAALAAPAAAITPEEAQSLPLAELARRVLGEAGGTIVEVDRPRWPTCDIMCPPLTEEQSRRAPPLSHGLRFYQRPYAASLALNNWTGLCGTTVVFVHYDESGEVTSFATGQRWGVPNGMERVTRTVPASDFMARFAEESAKCQGADVRKFFTADDDSSALRVAIAAQLFAEAARRGGRLPFKLVCRSAYGGCPPGGEAETVAEAFRPSRIAQLSQVDCDRPDEALTRFGPDGCYELTLDRPGESILVEVADAYSELKLKRVEYALAMVVY
jgi:hypothetical protein